jgi:HK97 family phage major capsid protein
MGGVAGFFCWSVMANELKAVLESPYELVVENHIVLFGGRDLSGVAYGKNKDGSMGECFVKGVDLESDYTQTGRLYVDFEHGRDPDEIGNDKHQILGFVDWKTARVDDEGVIVRRVLNRRHGYMKWLEPLIKAGLVGNSSESVPGKAEKSDSGEITRWPLKRDTLTVTPMEPRMLEGNTITAVKALEAMKALADEFPEYKSFIPPDTALPGKDETKPISNKSENKKMENEDVKALVAQGIADAMAEQTRQAEAKAVRDAEIKAAADEAYKKAVEDIKAAGPKVFYHSTEPVDDDNDGMQAFKSWMSGRGENSGLIRPDSSFEKIGDAKAAWNVTTGGSGGFLVPDPLYNQIIAKRSNSSWVRQVPVQEFTTESDHLLVPRESTSMTNFVLTAEAGSYDENEGDVTQKDLILYKYTKLVKASEEFLQYQSTNWESYLANQLGRSVAGTENTIYTSGTGTGEPEGVVTGATVANTTATTDVILPAELATLFGYLGKGYDVAGETATLMANVTKWYLAGQTGNPFLYQMTPAGSPDNILGTPVVINDVLEPYTTASAKCIVRGNFNFYGVVEKPGMIVQRNPYLFMGTGQIGIYAKIFRGGGVLQSEAFHYLTNKAS